MDLQNIFITVLNYSLVGSIIAFLILFIKRALNDKLSAHWHYYIWLVLIIRLMIPFNFESSLSFVHFLPSFAEYKINESMEIPIQNQTTTPPLNMGNIKSKDEDITSNEMNGPLVTFQPKTNLTVPNFNTEIIKIEAKDSISQSVTTNQIIFNILNLNTLGMLWLFGVLMVIILFLIENFDYNWRLSKQTKCKDDDILSLLEACKKKLKVRSNIQMIYDDKIVSPSIIGFLVPKILIPKPLFESLSKSEKKYVLLHELTHFKKKDVLIQWMSIIVLAIHWFNPIIWYSFYHLRKDCELSCDATVLSQLKKDEHLAYGNTLLSVLGKVSKPTFIPRSIGMSSSLSDMKLRMKRIHMIKKQTRTWMMFSSLITVCIVLVGFTIFDLNHSNNDQQASQSKDGNIQSDHETEVDPIKSVQEISSVESAGTWTEVSSMNQARDNHATGVIDGKIYVVGGSRYNDQGYEYLSSLEMYDPQKDRWIELASMNQARHNHTTGVIDGKIYVVGGSRYNDNNQAYEFLSSLEMYDPQKDRWIELASMNQARGYHTTEIINGKIYAVGGYGSDSNVLSSLEVYDPQTNTWTELNSMSDARVKFAIEVIQGKIYVVGGKNNNSDYLFSSEVYDPETNIWTKLAGMNRERDDFSTEVIGGKIYVIGGYIGNFMKYRKENFLSSMEVYDPKTNTWTQLASMNQVRRNHATEVLNGKIYVTGGYYDYNHLLSVEVYNPQTETWTELTNMNQAKSGHETEVIDGKIYAIGDNVTEVYNFMK
ncbi:M56 family metallopeptidase [Chengkuizengella marina]|nr:M56 family metallopeptidase [Chengkuizengella marina]